MMGLVLRVALLATLLSASSAWARVPVIVVDPGHGGTQEGALGPNGKLEKDLALQISHKLRSELQALGAKVLLTRERDSQLGLADRVTYANRKRPDLFISVHANAMPTNKLKARIRGIETYFLSASASGAEAASTAARENAEAPVKRTSRRDDTLAFILQDLQRTEAHVDSSRLAYAVHQQLIAATRANDRGVHQAPFYVLNGLEAPAILVEVGYLTHPEECQKLASAAYQQTLARAIAQGVKVFLSQTRQRDGRAAAVGMDTP